MSPASQGAKLAGRKAKRRAPNRALVRRAMDAARLAQERGAKQVVRRYLMRQHQGILAALGTERKSGNDGWARLLTIDISGDIRTVVDRVEDILGQTVDWPGQERALLRELRPVWDAAYASGAKLAADTYGLPGVQQPRLTRHLIEQGAARVKGITDTTRQALAKTIADGIMAGDGRGQMIDRVQRTMPGVSPGRASVIAANEVHISLMSGNFDMLKAAGYATKTWLTAGDGDVRKSHQRLHGKTIGIDERFENGLLYPGDPNGPPAEVIGCRCDLIAGEPIQEPIKDPGGVTLDTTVLLDEKIDPWLYEEAQKIEPLPGYDDIISHGNEHDLGIAIMGQNRAVAIQWYVQAIKAQGEYEPGKKIRLLSCRVGRYDDGPAQQLADALGVEVLASPYTVRLEGGQVLLIGDDDNIYTGPDGWRTFYPKEK